MKTIIIVIRITFCTTGLSPVLKIYNIVGLGWVRSII